MKGCIAIVIFDSHSDAENIVKIMRDFIHENGSAFLSDYYDLCDVPCTDFDATIGWTDFHEATIERVNGGYTIVLPPLDFDLNP